VWVVRYVGRDGRVADAWDGGEQSCEPDEPRLGAECVRGELQYLEGEADDYALLAAEILD
jgi:hypothetical protein